MLIWYIICYSLYARSSPIIDSDDEDDENEGEEWVFPVPDKKSKHSGTYTSASFIMLVVIKDK